MGIRRQRKSGVVSRVTSGIAMVLMITIASPVVIIGTLLTVGGRALSAVLPSVGGGGKSTGKRGYRVRPMS